MDRMRLKGSTRIIYDELKKQKAAVRIVDTSSSLLEYTDNSGQSRLLFSTSSDKSSAVGLNIARNKIRTKIIANELGIPTPADRVCTTFDEVLSFFEDNNRVVIKPLDNSGGSGVSTNITDVENLQNAYEYAMGFGQAVIAQQHMEGTDVRVLIVAEEFCSAVERHPASVCGDGASTIMKLVDAENNNGIRGNPERSSLLKIDQAAVHRHLGERINEVPAKDAVVQVAGPANVSLGGILKDASHKISDKMKRDAIAITAKLKLGICGVDMIWDATTNQYWLIEVNAVPGIDIHNDPYSGITSDAPQRYVKWLLG